MELSDGEFGCKKKHVDLKKVTFGPSLFGGCFMFGLLSYLGSILSRTKKKTWSFFGPKKEVPFGSPPLFFGGFPREKNKLDGVVPISGYSSKVAKPLDTRTLELDDISLETFLNLVVGIL